MTKDVLINISGLQIDLDADDNLEIVTRGQYYVTNNRQFILFDEYLDTESNEVTKNILKFSDNSVELTKRGIANVHMVFEQGKDTTTYYDTPFGSLFMGIYTKQILIHETDDLINLTINYDLSVNNNHVSTCNICVKITSINE